jgi:hypothetical protein
VDKWYGDEGYSNYKLGKEGWNMSQSMMNFVEILFQVLFLSMHAKRDAGATVVALIVSVSTFIKTVLYMMIIFNGTATDIVPTATCLLKFDTAACKDFISIFVIPNGIWIVVPFFVIYSTASQLARANALAPTKKYA